jgi:putative ABC transport system ATP-binding protein
MLSTSRLRYRYPAERGPGDRAAFELSVDPIDVPAGGSLALVGPSGCGKSTLLALLSGERVPDEGVVRFDGVGISQASDAERRAFRIRHVGLVFQDFRLIESLSLLENILLPCRLHPALRLDGAARQRAHALADRLGIAHLLARRPDRLSHGERQRGAVARALLAQPRLLLADEPTGNLDPHGKRALLSELLGLAKQAGAVVVVATHDHALLPSFDAVRNLSESRAEAPR